MLLEKFAYVWVLIFSALIVGGCASNPSISQYDDRVLRGNYWLVAGYALDRTYSYAPQETVYKADGTVTTLIVATLRSTGTPVKPGKWDINCHDKVIRTSKLDQNGNWELVKDWHLLDAKSVGQLVVTNLCYPVTVPNNPMRFITVGEDKKNPNRYYTYMWEANKNYAADNQQFKVFKFGSYDSLEKKNEWGYVYLRCSDRSYALQVSPDSKKPTWLKEAELQSAVGYLTVQACGFKSQALNTSAAQSSQKPNSMKQTLNPIDASSRIDEAKIKCTQLGLKKGTEDFGNCVLRFSN